MNAFQVVTVVVVAIALVAVIRAGAEVLVRWIESKGHDGL